MKQLKDLVVKKPVSCEECIFHSTDLHFDLCTEYVLPSEVTSPETALEHNFEGCYFMEEV